MKANKALKRLNKIEALLSNVTERYSASEPHIRDVLRDANAAVTRAKEAVTLQASFKGAKNTPVTHSEATSKATPEPSTPKRKLSAAGRKAIIVANRRRWALKRAEAANGKRAAVKKAAVKTPSTKVAKTSAPATKAAAKKTALAAAQTVTTPTTQ